MKFLPNKMDSCEVNNIRKKNPINKNLKIFMIFTFIIIFLSLINSIIITNFDGFSINENITFYGNENISLNISIQRNADVTYASLNLSGLYALGDFFNSQYYADQDTDTYHWYDWYETTGQYPNAMGQVINPSEDIVVAGLLFGSFTFDTLGYHTIVVKIWNATTGGTELGNCTRTEFIDPNAWTNQYSRSCYFNDNITLLSGKNYYVEFSPFIGGEKLKIQDATGSGTRNGGTYTIQSGYSGTQAPDINFKLIGIYRNYTENPEFYISNNSIWYYPGTFNKLNNKTEDFSNYLRTIITQGSCSCQGCSTQGDNCTIPFTLHSDKPGIINYNSLNISYNNYPIVYLNYPSDTSYSSSEVNFNCSYSDEINLKNVTFYLWNSSYQENISIPENISGNINSSIFSVNFTNSGVYYWNCLATNNNSRSIFAENNFSINIDIDNPIVSMLWPQNNSYLSYINNILFNYTSIHSTQTVECCSLYGNFNGTWAINQTSCSIDESAINNFSLNLSEGNYLWNIGCNTSETGNFAFDNGGNKTFTLDVTNPEVNISIITTTVGSQTLQFFSNASDINLDSCKYSIYNSDGGVDGLNSNVSFSCNNVFSATTTDYSSYNLTVVSTDLAGNENSTTKGFTIERATSNNNGGGSASSLEKIPVIAIQDIQSIKEYTDLEKAIIYTQINSYCTLKSTGQLLAVEDLSGECSLKKSDIEEIRAKLLVLGVEVSYEDLLSFYGNFASGNLEQIYETLGVIKEFNLFTSVLGITNELIINPPRLDRPFFFYGGKNVTISYIFTANKPLKECDIISGGDFSCSLISSNSVEMILQINNTNFFDQVFKGEMLLISDASPENTETKRISLVPRVYNLGYPFLGIPVIWIISFGGILLFSFSIFFIIRSRIKLKSERIKK